MVWSIGEEFRCADLPDARLRKRAMSIAERWSASPDESFPEMMESAAELQGLYSFVENESVTAEPLLAAHAEQTVVRIDASKQRVVVVAHDTTVLAFGGESPREGLGWLGHDQQGCFGHFALAMSADGSRLPFGVLGLSVFGRPRPPRRTKETKSKPEPNKTIRAANPDRESLRWAALINETGARLRGHAVPIHVVDREAESYEFLAAMKSGNHRFVARVRAVDRVVESVAGEPSAPAKLQVVVNDCEPIADRTTEVSRRGRSPLPARRKTFPARAARDARLEIAATTIRLPRLSNLDRELPASLDVNVVHVREVGLPDGTEPVEWLLYTSEPIDTAEDALRVVDHYRARWTIEEYFKALKTGCAYEMRQLETGRALMVALALCIPVAWQMLLIRTQARLAGDAPASSVLNARQLTALRTIARRPLTSQPTAREVFYAIAAVGGHLEQNGPPGWQTLRRGLDKLLFAAEVLAKAGGREM